MPAPTLDPVLSPSAPSQLAEFVDLEALTLGLRLGERWAIESLVHRFGPMLYGAARAILHDESDASDAVQDGLVSALGSIGTLEDPQALPAWLKRIVTNAALLIRRKQTRRRERAIETLLPSFEESGVRHDPGPQNVNVALENMESRELVGLVRGAIEDLPEAFREVLLLRDIVGLSNTEAASELGITPNLTKVRLHRARQALRTLLAERLNEA